MAYIGTAAAFAFGLLAAIPVSSGSKLFHSSYACIPQRYNLPGDPSIHRGVLDRFFRWDSDKQIDGREGRQDFGDMYQSRPRLIEVIKYTLRPQTPNDFRAMRDIPVSQTMVGRKLSHSTESVVRCRALGTLWRRRKRENSWSSIMVQES